VAKRIAPTADGNPAPGTAPNDPLNGPALHDGI